MEFKFNDLALIIDTEKTTEETNSYKLVSTEDAVNSFNNFIEIVDENGNEVTFTPEKFLEIFDNNGLEGFIL